MLALWSGQGEIIQMHGFERESQCVYSAKSPSGGTQGSVYCCPLYALWKLGCVNFKMWLVYEAGRFVVPVDLKSVLVS